MHIVPWITRLTLVLSLVLTLAACGADATVRPTVGQPAPNFTLQDLNQRDVRLADFQGKVVIVNFWATWCPPCVNETPRLVDWQSKHGDDGLQVIGVDTLFQDSREAVDEFVATYAVTYPMLVDDTGNVSKQWEARQLPRSFVIDREGTVRYIRIGELTEEDFQAQVMPLLDS